MDMKIQYKYYIDENGNKIDDLVKINKLAETKCLLSFPRFIYNDSHDVPSLVNNEMSLKNLLNRCFLIGIELNARNYHVQYHDKHEELLKCIRKVLSVADKLNTYDIQYDYVHDLHNEIVYRYFVYCNIDNKMLSYKLSMETISRIHEYLRRKLSNTLG